MPKDTITISSPVINSITSPFKKKITDKITDYYYESKTTVKNKPGLFDSIIKFLFQKAVISGAGESVEAIVKTAAKNDEIARAASAVTTVAFIIGFYFSNKSADAKVKIAKEFINTIDKAGGIDIFSALIADYLTERFYYLLIGLHESNAESTEQMAIFFSTVVIAIVYQKFEFWNKKELTAKNIIEEIELSIVPELESELYEEKIFKILGINKKIKYAGNTCAIKDVLMNAPLLTPDGSFWQKKDKNGGFPPQYFKQTALAEKLGYIKARPKESNEELDEQNFSSGKESIQAYLSEKYVELVNKNKQYKKSTYIFFEFLNNRNQLVTVINGNKPSFQKELITYLRTFFIFYYNLIFNYRAHSNEEKREEITLFISKECNWLKQLSVKIDGSIAEYLQLILNLKDYLVSDEISKDIIMSERSVVTNYVIFKHDTASAYFTLMKKLEENQQRPSDIDSFAEIVKELFSTLVTTSVEFSATPPNNDASVNNLDTKKKVDPLDVDKKNKFRLDLISAITDQNQLLYLLNDINSQYGEQALRFILNSLGEDDSYYLLERCWSNKAADRISVSLLIKFGANPHLVIFKGFYSKVADIFSYETNTEGKISIYENSNMLYQVIKQLKEELIPNIFEYKLFLSFLDSNKKINQEKINNFLQNEKKIKDNLKVKLKNLVKLYSENLKLFQFIINFICCNSDTYELLEINEKELLKKENIIKLDKALATEPNIFKETILHHALIIENKILTDLLLVDLGGLFRNNIHLSFYKQLPTSAKDQINEINLHLFNWAKIFADIETFSENLLANYELHKKYNTLSIMLYSLKFPLGRNGETALFSFVTKPHKKFELLRKFIQDLQSKKNNVAYFRILYSILFQPFSDDKNKEDKILLMNPVTLAAYVGNLEALMFFKEIIIKYLLSNQFFLEKNELAESHKERLNARISDIFGTADYYGGTALHYAALMDNIEVIDWLSYEASVDPSLQVVHTPKEVRNILKISPDEIKVIDKCSLDWLIIDDNEESLNHHQTTTVTSVSLQTFSAMDYAKERPRKDVIKLLKLMSEKWIDNYKKRYAMTSRESPEAVALAMRLTALNLQVSKIKNKDSQNPLQVIAKKSPGVFFHLINRTNKKFSSQAFVENSELYNQIPNFSQNSLNEMLLRSPNFFNDETGLIFLMLFVGFQKIIIRDFKRYDLVITLMKFGADKIVTRPITHEYKHVFKIIESLGNEVEKEIKIDVGNTPVDIATGDEVLLKLLKQGYNQRYFSILQGINQIIDDIQLRRYARLTAVYQLLEIKLNEIQSHEYVDLLTFVDHRGNTLLYLLIKLYEKSLITFKIADNDPALQDLNKKLLAVAKNILNSGVNILFEKNWEGKSIAIEAMPSKQDFENSIYNSKFQLIKTILVEGFKSFSGSISDPKLKEIVLCIANNPYSTSADVLQFDQKKHSLLSVLIRHEEWSAFDKVISKLSESTNRRWIFKDNQQLEQSDDEIKGLTALHYLCCLPKQETRIQTLLNMGMDANSRTKAAFSINIAFPVLPQLPGNQANRINQEDKAAREEPGKEIWENPSKEPEVRAVMREAERLIKEDFKTRVSKKEFDSCLGKIIGNSDSFFEAIAQCLNELQNSHENTTKSVRKICYDYICEVKEDSWIKKALEEVKQNLDDYKELIQYSFTEMKKPDFKKDPSQCISGMPAIEGRIICEKLNLKIHLLETKTKSSEVIVSESLITKEGHFVRKWRDYSDDNTVIHLASYERFTIAVLGLNKQRSQVWNIASINAQPQNMRDNVAERVGGQRVPIELPKNTSPIMIAVKTSNKSAIMTLGNKADYTCKDETQHTAIYYAVHHEQFQVLKLLMLHRAAMVYFFNEFNKEISNEPAASSIQESYRKSLAFVIGLIAEQFNISEEVADLKSIRDFLNSTGEQFKNVGMLIKNKKIFLSSSLDQKAFKSPGSGSGSNSNKTLSPTNNANQPQNSSVHTDNETGVNQVHADLCKDDYEKINKQLNNLEYRNAFLKPDKSGITPLQLSIFLSKDNDPLFQNIIAYFKDEINKPDNNQRTLLWYAILFRKFPIIEELMKYDIKVAEKDIFLINLDDKFDKNLETQLFDLFKKQEWGIQKSVHPPQQSMTPILGKMHAQVFSSSPKPDSFMDDVTIKEGKQEDSVVYKKP